MSFSLVPSSTTVPTVIIRILDVLILVIIFVFTFVFLRGAGGGA
jgi:hypothetical protein